jgi:Ser/Thr protein kinase RdoA (MazF antagonist)
MTDPLAATATEALLAWGGGRLTALTLRENAVYRAELADGCRAALRLHRPGYQTDAAIEAELWWCGALADAGFPAPRPIPTLSGRLHTRAGDRRASLVTWCPGLPVGAAGTPLAGTPAEQSRLFTAIGALIADLHGTTDALTLPAGFTRPRWDAEGLLGEAPLWGRFWTSPALSDPESALLRQARSQALADLATFAAEAGDFGLIHADVLRENLLRDGPGLWLVDFDDSGFGFRLYDLGTALSQSLEEPQLPRLADALLTAYARTRPLPADAARRLTLFTLLRTLASCGWIASRARPGDPRLGFYAQRALGMARLYLDGRTLGSG